MGGMTEHAADPVQPDTVQPDPVEPDTIQPDTIQPDTKDWTWVLQRRCPDCGFEAGSVQRGEIGALARKAARRFADVARRPDAEQRPRPQVWSGLEYLCHVRDVCRLFDQRLRLMLQQDDPQFANWDQDRTAVQSRYAAQNPRWVVEELRTAAGKIADGYDAVRPDQWARTGRRGDGSTFTVESLGQYFLHDLYHHLHDVAA